jgi:hypothetical protein
MEDRYELGSDYWDNLDCGYEKKSLVIRVMKNCKRIPINVM